ncbi:uncharacterized protein SCHCODRAFT_02666094 [Schizophyllum commune H4-8]|nr:uncharacterized protein SCHCODRAFT_02666094 [Schizophyllum commune H4-8]KAI5895825.1 hypothetical protein SCHCODRAFT_02666094 [Schizophyllum commune H4-8]
MHRRASSISSDGDDRSQQKVRLVARTEHNHHCEQELSGLRATVVRLREQVEQREKELDELMANDDANLTKVHEDYARLYRESMEKDRQIILLQRTIEKLKTAPEVNNAVAPLEPAKKDAIRSMEASRMHDIFERTLTTIKVDLMQKLNLAEAEVRRRGEIIVNLTRDTSLLRKAALAGAAVNVPSNARLLQAPLPESISRDDLVTATSDNRSLTSRAVQASPSEAVPGGDVATSAATVASSNSRLQQSPLAEGIPGGDLTTTAASSVAKQAVASSSETPLDRDSPPSGIQASTDSPSARHSGAEASPDEGTTQTESHVADRSAVRDAPNDRPIPSSLVLDVAALKDMSKNDLHDQLKLWRWQLCADTQPFSLLKNKPEKIQELECLIGRYPDGRVFDPQSRKRRSVVMT